LQTPIWILFEAHMQFGFQMQRKCTFEPGAVCMIIIIIIIIRYTYAPCGDNFHACLYCCLLRLVDFPQTNETMVQGYLACRIPGRRIRTFSSLCVKSLNQICSYFQLEDNSQIGNTRLQQTKIKIPCYIIGVSIVSFVVIKIWRNKKKYKLILCIVYLFKIIFIHCIMINT